jgi:heavy metal sensor kinase
MIFNSIRWRVQTWHGLILVIVLAGFGFMAYHVAWDNQLRRIDQELDRQLMAALRPRPQEQRPQEQPPPGDYPPPGRPWPGDRRSERPPPDWNRSEMLARIRDRIQQASLETDQTNTVYFVMWQEDGKVLTRTAGAPADVPLPERQPAVFQSLQNTNAPAQPARFGPEPMMAPIARARGELRELFRFGPLGDCILVGRSIVPELAAMRQLAVSLFAAGAGVLLFGLAGGWWLASRTIRPIEDISATAVKISAGDLSQRINAADTESELGRLAGVLNSTFARLEAAFAHQARFTSDASHELRTPVAVIISQTQTALARERSGPEYREALEACQRAAQRMRKLTESLLELARLDAGQETIKRERFDLARAAREGVELVRPLAAERGIEIHCDLAAVECPGDAERIGQVVTNLMTNAIHFNRDRGEVRVSARAENGAALLTVADTGEGIPVEDLPHVFERFYRVDKSRSRIQGRTGLGLAICKAMVDAHGGVIEVSSQSGVGSVFTVKLPLQ